MSEQGSPRFELQVRTNLNLQWAFGPAVIVRNEDMHYVKIPHIEGYYDPMSLYFPAGGEKRSLYLEFADLDHRNDGAIKAFMTKYGILGLLYRDRDFLAELGSPLSKSGVTDPRDFPLSPLGIRLAVPDGTDLFDPLGAVRDEIRHMSDLLELWRSLSKGTITADEAAFAWSALMFDFLNPSTLPPDVKGAFTNYKEHCAKQLTTAERIAEIAGDVIGNRIRIQLLGQVTMSIKHEKGRFFKVWRPLTLLAAMYLMLAEDVSAGATLERCSNHKCTRHYLLGRSDQRYCSATCQNQDRQRRHRERKRQASSGLTATDEGNVKV